MREEWAARPHIIQEEMKYAHRILDRSHYRKRPLGRPVYFVFTEVKRAD
jgi:hypothetical protein